MKGNYSQNVMITFGVFMKEIANLAPHTNTMRIKTVFATATTIYMQKWKRKD
jgi:hypothetical protein